MLKIAFKKISILQIRSVKVTAIKEKLGSIEPNGVSKLLLYFCSVHKKTFALSEQLLGSA